MNIAVGMICTALMVLGAAELVRIFVFLWASPAPGEELVVTVRINSAEECEYAVRAAAERIRWQEGKGSCRLLCIDQTEDPEVAQICGFLSLRYPYLRLCKSSDLVYHMQEETMER